MGHLSDRADNFAKKFVKRAPVDERSTDEKMAEFMKVYSPRKAMRDAHRRLKQMKGGR